MTQLLWIGCLESSESFQYKANRGYNLASAQVSQKNLFDGIERVSNYVFDSINGSVLPPYPVYKERIVEPIVWSHRENAFDVSVGFENYKYINRINCKKSMIDEVNKWCRDRYKHGKLIVFVYSMRSAPMATACRIKRIIPDAKIYLIITDLPKYMDLGESKFKKFLKKIDGLSIKGMQNYMDGYILYTENMAKILKIPDDKWLLMEGSYEGNENELVIQSSKKRAIMYSGKLDLQYGIDMLLRVFSKIQDNNLELWLTGGGNAEELIVSYAKSDSRIKYFGFLPDRKMVLSLQREAMFLISMRLPSEEASNYCFPSKLFEYMATGTPVLSFKLGGIPEEYYQYLYVIEKEDDTVFKKTLENLLKQNYEMILNRGTQASEFIKKEKTSIMQCNKIWEFVN